MAAATLGDHPIDWTALAADYDAIREHIVDDDPGVRRLQRASAPPGRLRPAQPAARQHDVHDTDAVRRDLSVNVFAPVTVPPGRLLLQTVRSHDQFNTTIYGLDDRYRGISGGRRVVFVSPDDVADLGLDDGDLVDIVSEWTDGSERRATGFRVVAYPTARGCCAAYFPEANVLVPLESVAERSRTPTSKAIVVRLERLAEQSVG